jgi:hypothetical protein
MMSTFHFFALICGAAWLTGVERATRARTEKKAAGARARPPSVYWWMVLVIWTNGPRSSHLITKSRTRRALFLLRRPLELLSPLLSFDVDNETLAARFASTLFYFTNCAAEHGEQVSDNAPLWFLTLTPSGNTTLSSAFRNWDFRRSLYFEKKKRCKCVRITRSESIVDLGIPACTKVLQIHDFFIDLFQSCQFWGKT